LTQKIVKKDEELADTRDRYEDIRIRLVNFSERSRELEDQADRLSEDVEAERRLRKSVEDAYAQLEDRMKETQALLRQAEDRAEKEAQDGERRRRRDVAEMKQVGVGHLHEVEWPLTVPRRLRKPSNVFV
jgi:chromosome segregation ATPase